MSTAPAPAFFSCYVSQGGSSLSVVLDKENADKLYQAIHEMGVPVSVWQADQVRTLGILLVPARGGLTLHLETCTGFPVAANGAIVDAEAASRGVQATGEIPAADARIPKAQVVLQSWPAAREVRLSKAQMEQLGQEAAKAWAVEVSILAAAEEAKLRRMGEDEDKDNGTGDKPIKQ